MRCLLFLAGALPILSQMSFFEPNQGQSGGPVDFIVRSGRHASFLSKASAAFPVGDLLIRMRFVSARSLSAPEGLEPTGGITSYFLGNDPKKWRSGVPHYAKVRYRDVYPGIDLLYYFRDGALEYDLIVSPGADPDRIEIAFEGVSRIVPREEGDLVLITNSGEMVHRRPKVIQNGKEVAGAYRVRVDNHVQFALAEYDRSQPLIIDPVVEFSTYIGGSALDVPSGIKTDAQGFSYLVGTSRSAIGPTLDPFQQVAGFSQDAFVLKLSPSGDRLLYYVFLGGDFDEYAQAIGIDANGNAYVGGDTRSLNFPTRSPLQAAMGGGFKDGFVVKISPDGRNLVYSTYIGGSREEDVEAIAVDNTGGVYIASTTYSIDFPVTPGCFQPRNAGAPDGYIAKVSPAGSSLVWSTYLGGSGLDTIRALELDAAGNVVIAGAADSSDFPVANGYRTMHRGGREAFAAKLSSDGSKLLWSTYLGNGQVFDLTMDSAGDLYMSGVAGQLFETKSAAQSTYGGGQFDVFAMKVSANGDQLIYATFIGGQDLEFQNAGIAVDSQGSAFVTGWTGSRDFPVKDSLQSFRGNPHDAFVTKVSPDGRQFLYSTLIGGNGDDRGTAITVDNAGNVFLAGSTSSSDFPTKNPLQAQYRGGLADLFLVKLSSESAPPARSALSAAPSVVLFSWTLGAAAPAAQTIPITAAAPTAFRVETSEGWLRAVTNRDTTPATLTVSIAPGNLAAGSYAAEIRLVTSDGARLPIQASLRVLDAPPTASVLSPSTVPVGSDELDIELSGTDFVSGSVVRLNANAQPTQFVSSTLLRFTVSKGVFAVPGSYAVTVVNPESAPSAPLTLSVGSPSPRVAANGIVSAASFTPGAVAPGEIITIFGESLGPPSLVQAALDSAGHLSAQLAGVRVLFDGIAAPLVYVSEKAVTAVVPYGVEGRSRTDVQIEYEGHRSITFPVSVIAVSPAFFTSNASGKGQVAAFNEDGTVNSATSPARAGSVIATYATGFGRLDPPALDGQISAPPLGQPVLPVSAEIGGIATQALYAGAAPGLVSGAIQVNLRVPEVPGGMSPVIVRVGDRRTQSEVFIHVAP